MGWHEDPYSLDNFRRIWDRSIRRGEVLTDWDRPLRAALDKRNSLRAQVRDAEASPKVSATNALRVAYKDSEELASAELERFLNEVRNKVQDRLEGSVGWGLAAGAPTAGKKTWHTDRTANAATYFEERIAERAIRASFDLRQSGRAMVSEALKTVLSDGSPKYVYRTDIRSCFESIPHADLLHMMTGNRELPRTILKQAQRLLHDYSALAGTNIGLPRGVGLSSVLAEVYLSALDRQIECSLAPAFWCRYVDDIVVVTSLDNRDAVSREMRRAARALSLRLNGTKTISFGSDAPRVMTFLGYRYSWKEGQLVVKLSQKRVDRIRDRLELTFNAYARSTSPARDDLLIKRVRFLTRNIRLSNNKRNALAGVFFSNSQVDEPLEQFQKLDRELVKYVDAHVRNAGVIKILAREGFETGFQFKRFLTLSPAEMNRVTAIWR